ncbi:uncharacterized protein EAE98_007887 [Botrytis deweyae]|uniref:Ig-like domain-containing protein n=1 Tax=Botrytis deweyae TaxID=2478750 RepID=A0ABQ7IG89_9HELO|nr:uncharacterized protein EAE98_007887 [Botrytis deweyae]KAF7923182.1 hypothetical protein EAE98_007887 [Botrytis deweyae]
MLSNYKPYEILPDKSPRSKCSRHPSIATSYISNLKSLNPPPNRPHTYSQPARMTHVHDLIRSRRKISTLTPRQNPSPHISLLTAFFTAFFTASSPVSRIAPSSAPRYIPRFAISAQKFICSCSEKAAKGRTKMRLRWFTGHPLLRIRLRQASGALVKSLFCYPRVASPSLLC